MKKIKLFFSALLLLATHIQAQQLKPGFDKGEYIEMLKIAYRQVIDVAKWDTVTSIPAPQEYQQAYRSPTLGLGNVWDLWTNKNGVAVISVRGTTAESVSWLANFYAAMVPAKGTFQLGDNNTFTYELALNPRAAVHIGWLVSMASLSKDILPKIDSCYKSGTKEFIITGHSQGGGITYLLTSYLYNLQKGARLPADIRFKTYCSAAPKPGNTYYAYEYEAMTQDGWAYNVINSADWVPEVPISIQTLKDFNTTNPFVLANDIIKKQKFGARLVSKYIYNRLNDPTEKARDNYQKYLGNLASGFVKKQIPGFKAPPYANTFNYVRTGATIVLLADADYYRQFPDDRNKIFMHHFPAPYLYLAQKLR